MPRLILDRDTQVDIVDGRTLIESSFLYTYWEMKAGSLSYAVFFHENGYPRLVQLGNTFHGEGDKTPTYLTYFELFGLLKKIKSVNKVEQYSPTAGIKLADSHGPPHANTNNLLSFWAKFTSEQ